jgi:integrase
MLLTQTGVRISEAIGLRWQDVHLGDDPHITVVEQFYKGKRVRLKTEASADRVPLSTSMASWLAELRPVDAAPDAPVFASKAGTPLIYANLYHRVLRPALRDSGLAVNVGTDDEPVWDYQGVGFHAFRKACGSLLFANGKTLKQVQGWLRHSQLATTLSVYINQVDGGLGSADAWDTILAPEVPMGGPSPADLHVEDRG